MFTHVMVGTNDIAAATKFHDAVMGVLGYAGSSNDTGTGRFYVGPHGMGGGAFGVTVPRDGNPACFANGGTIGFQAPSPEVVDKWHVAGLANGGMCEGKPGERSGGWGKSYGAYLRDPDGNKICVFAPLQ